MAIVTKVKTVVFAEIDRDLIRENLSKYTDMAFQLLPRIEKPRILDIGCGTGVPTLRLLGLCSGNIIGVDIDENSIRKLNKKIREKNLTGRVKTVVCSLKNLPFEQGSFDIVWAEGSISFIGFNRGLKEWKRYIKNNGFLVVHDELGNYMKKIRIIESNKYTLYGFFMLSQAVWWNEYYKPLDNLIRDVTSKDDLEDLKSIKNEIELFKKKPERFESAFFIMRKK